MTAQKLKPTLYSDFEAARSYLSVISALNKLELTDLELNLLAFIAVKGTISHTNYKQTFCDTFGSSENSVNNAVGRLVKKRKLLIKIDNKIRLIPQIALNFKEPVVLKITFDAKTREEDSKGVRIPESSPGVTV